jgi:hypothetical protein
MGCGKRRGEMIGLGFLYEGVLLPQADGWMGMFWCCSVRGDFMFFLSLHHFAMHFCLAIPTCPIPYI